MTRYALLCFRFGTLIRVVFNVVLGYNSGTDVDLATVKTQNKVNIALPSLPPEVQRVGGIDHHREGVHRRKPAVADREKVRDASIGCIHSYQPCRTTSGSRADAEAAVRLGIYWNNAFPDVQCRGDYPSPIRAAIERHIRPGDLTRIRRPLDWFGLNHYSPVYVKAHATSMLRYDFADKPADETLKKGMLGA